MRIYGISPRLCVFGFSKSCATEIFRKAGFNAKTPRPNGIGFQDGVVISHKARTGRNNRHATTIPKDIFRKNVPYFLFNS
jgi:hypothetical protein